MAKIKEGFKGERMLSIPEDILQRYRENALIAPLYIRKMGYFPKVKYHYVQKDNGTDYCMLIYCVAGRGHYCINGCEEHSLEADQYIILPDNMPYRFWADEKDPWTIYWVHFEGNLSRQFVQYPITARNIIPGKTSRLQDRIDVFNEIYSSFSMAYTQEYMVHASLTLYHLLSSFVHLEAFRHYKSGQTDQSFAAQVIHYMDENVSRNLSLQDLAKHFKYSPSHFSALFQKETGYSPINYYIQLKVRRACQYVELSQLRFFEIAEMVGFNEPAYFTRIFTKVMGMSPSEYRHREAPNNNINDSDE
ncbi:MAG: AraC family transcriptional regulator [Muribaculaceae bacterium]